jgi:hypothetical protein
MELLRTALMARIRQWKKDHGPYKDRGIVDAYKVGAKIAMSREPTHGGKITEIRYGRSKNPSEVAPYRIRTYLS